MMITRLTAIGIAAGLALGTAACSKSANQLLSTGSVQGGKPGVGAAAVPPPVKPEDRALNVAAVSARAVKCGYNFDPAKLRANYLASETATGLPADALVQLTRVYDFAYAKVSAAVATNETYCTDQRVAAIKTSLTRHLAGDFAPPKRKVAVAGGGWFDWGEPEPGTKEVLNPDWVNNPKHEKQTKRVEEE